MGREGLHVLVAVTGAVARGCARERRIEVIVGGFQVRNPPPEQLLRSRGGLQGRAEIPGEEASLQLLQPVRALTDGGFRMVREMPLEGQLIQSRVIERAEIPGQPAQTADEPEL